MDFTTREGITIFTATAWRTKADITISLLSRRAALLALRQSVYDKWRAPVFAYTEAIYYNEIILVGFQPKTGFHIAIKKPKG